MMIRKYLQPLLIGIIIILGLINIEVITYSDNLLTKKDTTISNLNTKVDELTKTIDKQDSTMKTQLIGLNDYKSILDQNNKELNKLKIENKELKQKLAWKSEQKKEIKKPSSVKKSPKETIKPSSTSDINLLYRLVEAEAGANNLEGRIAVANVVINRVRSKEFPNSLEAVIKQTNQFEPVVTGTVYRINPTATTIKAVDLALNGKKVVPDNCLYFWATYLDKDNSLWNNHKVIATLGDNVFCI